MSVDHKKLTIAYHETGHAVTALICCQGIKKVSLGEMDSLRGTEKYLGSTQLESFEKNEKFTISEAIRRAKISLGGYASEILYSGGSAKIGGDDLTLAIQLVESMMQSEDFRAFTATLPIPDPGALDSIGNPNTRAFIDYLIDQCVQDLEPFAREIQLIAETLYQKEELTGDQVSALFNSGARNKGPE